MTICAQPPANARRLYSTLIHGRMHTVYRITTENACWHVVVPVR